MSGLLFLLIQSTTLLACSINLFMKKLAAHIIVLFVLSPAGAFSQYYFSANNTPEGAWVWEGGLNFVAGNCLTDIGGGSGNGKKFLSDCNWNQTRPGAGLTVAAVYESAIVIGLQANYLGIAGDDAVLQGRSGAAVNRYHRNLRFRTQVLEALLQSNWCLLTLLRPGNELPAFSPFVTAGIGVFYYNPQASLNNTWIDLRPLHTEGQNFAAYPGRRAYSKLSWCVPLGGGVRYDAGKSITASLQVQYRFTGTDYLDDVSKQYINPALFDKYLAPADAAKAKLLADRSIGFVNQEGAIRGNPSNRDAYFSVQLGLAIVFDRIRRK